MPLDPSTPRFPSTLHRCLRGFRPKSGAWLGLALLACALVTTSCIRVKHRSGARTSTARVPIAEGTLNVFGLELTGEPGTPHEGFALSIPATMSWSVALMTADEADELNGKLIMLGTAVDSLKAASSGSTPFCLRISEAPGFTTSNCVSRWASRLVAAAKL